MSDQIVILCNGETWYQSGMPNISNKISKVKTTSKIKQKKVEPIIYPIFEEASEYSDCPMWKGIFKQAAMGIFRKDFKFNGDTLLYSSKKKLNSIVLNISDPRILYKEMKTFIQKNAGIFSEKDLEEHKNIVLNENIKDITSWSQIKKMSDKIKFINDFVNKISQNLKLSPIYKDKLNDIINIGIISKYFDRDNIIIKNGEIDSILGLKYEGFNKYKIDVDIINRKSKLKRCVQDIDTLYTGEIISTIDSYEDDSTLDTYNNFINKWNKLLICLYKKQIKYKT